MTNNAPKGPVTILGYAYVGETVIARPNGVGDADGINYDTISLQWLRDGKEILGATSQEYTVNLADEGTQISVRYSYTDYGGTREVVTSDPEPAVPPAGTPIPDGEASYSPLIILGDAVVGEYLLARPNAVTDENGINYASTSFQWLRDGKAIPGATSERYDVTDADIGTEISVKYSYRDLLGKSKSVTSNPKPEVPSPDGVAPVPDVPKDDGGTGDVPVPDVPTDDGSTGDVPVADNDSNPLVIIGDAVVGKYLIAGSSSVTDPNGINSAYASYQWLRDGKAIPGATAKKYVVTETDIGAEISFQYSYRDLRGTTKYLTSQPTSEVPSPDGVMRLPNILTDDGDTGDVLETVEEVVLEGTPVSDMLTAVAGLQHIDGSDGVDTAVFAGNQAHFTVNFSLDGVTVTDRTEGGLGTIALDNVEFIDFDTDLPVFGGPMHLGHLDGHIGLDEEAFENLVELYIAYFNRAPDAVGLAFWGNAFADGLSMEEMAALFIDQDETRETYPSSMSNAEFATAVYNNVLGRVPDAEGFDFWVGVLDNGAVGRDTFILSVLEGVKAAYPAGASVSFINQMLEDRQYLSDKADIGAYFAVHKGMSDVADAAQVMALFDGSQSSIQNALNAIETHYDAALSADSGDFLMPLVGVLDDPFVG